MAPQAGNGCQAPTLRPATNDWRDEEGNRGPRIHKSKARQQVRGSGVRILDTTRRERRKNMQCKVGRYGIEGFVASYKRHQNSEAGGVLVPIRLV